MKKNILYLLFVSALLFTGCGDKSQALDPTKDAKAEKEAKPETKKEQKADFTVPEKKVEEEQVKVVEDATGPEDDEAQKNNIEKRSVYFDFDKFNIRSDMQPVVEEIASLINERYKGSTIKIEGNCDEWGTDEYNYALGLRRAKSIKDTLSKHGVDGEMFKLMSYGESNPVCNEHNERCWSKNRRAEFRIIK